MDMDREAYLKEVSRVITQNFKANDVSGSMTAARAGLLVHQVRRTGPMEYGFSKFKDALLELERRGEIRIGFNSKQALAIWLPAATGDTGSETERGSDLQRGKPFRPLRKRLWLAFVVETPVGHRFMNKKTGDVLLGQDQNPEPEDEWAEVEKIPDAEEKDDAGKFIEAENLKDDPQLQKALQSAYWYNELPDRLRDLGAGLAAKWNRRRSVLVFEKAEAWRVRHGIPEELVYQAIEPHREGRPHLGTGLHGELRDALLGAVQTMETAELLQLRIPARCLVKVLRPDLNLHE